MSNQPAKKVITREFEDIETNMLFNLMRMSEILMTDICRRFEAKGSRFQQKKKQNYNKFIAKVNDALRWFDETMEDDYIEGANGSTFQYDKMRFEANELIRLLLLYVDRVSLNPDNYHRIFQYIRSLESCQVVKEEDLDWFYRIKLKPQQ